jgi:hypothetical protein
MMTYSQWDKLLEKARRNNMGSSPETCPCPWCADSEAAIRQERINALRAAMMSDPGEPETKEQYQQRMEEKAKQREVADKIAQELKKASTEEDAERHWSDRIYKPWPGAMGS